MFGPVTSLYLFVPVLYGLLFLHEGLSAFKLIGLALALVGTVLIGKPPGMCGVRWGAHRNKLRHALTAAMRLKAGGGGRGGLMTSLPLYRTIAVNAAKTAPADEVPVVAGEQRELDDLGTIPPDQPGCGPQRV